MREALGQRQIAKSGKREIIRGKNLMTTPEMREQLMEWESNKKKRKVSAPKKAKRKPRKVKEVSSEGSESDWHGEISDQVEILDCIEVET